MRKLWIIFPLVFLFSCRTNNSTLNKEGEKPKYTLEPQVQYSFDNKVVSHFFFENNKYVWIGVEPQISKSSETPKLEFPDAKKPKVRFEASRQALNKVFINTSGLRTESEQEKARDLNKVLTDVLKHLDYKYPTKTIVLSSSPTTKADGDLYFDWVTLYNSMVRASEYEKNLPNTPTVTSGKVTPYVSPADVWRTRNIRIFQTRKRSFFLDLVLPFSNN